LSPVADKSQLVIDKNQFHSLQQQMLLQNMHPSEKKSVYQMVYDTDKLGSKRRMRPVYFSMLKVVLYKEMQLLVLLSALE
jgi:hypothetical protein